MKKKRLYREVYNPEPDVEYWVVYDPVKGIPHYFRSSEEAYEYSSRHHIEDINVFKECFN